MIYIFYSYCFSILFSFLIWWYSCIIKNYVRIDCHFSENGLLSYENPNYHLGPSSNHHRLDDALNSNTDNIYEDIYQELDDICNIGHGGNGGGGGVTKTPLSSNTTLTSGRKTYATLDIGSMGVDINTGPLTQINSANIIDNRRYYLKLSVFLFSFLVLPFFISAYFVEVFVWFSTITFFDFCRGVEWNNGNACDKNQSSVWDKYVVSIDMFSSITIII